MMITMSGYIFHLQPPTATPIYWEDLWGGYNALHHPVEALHKFNQSLIRYLDISPLWTVSSGRAALKVILLALHQFSERKRVIIPAYTCSTVVQSVIQAGLIPIPCDISPDTFDLDRASLYKIIGPDILAVIPTHLFGLAQDIQDIIDICQKESIYCVEDAAQSFGAEINGKKVGGLGSAGFYSLGLGKSLPTGHGGVIVAHDELSEAITQIINSKMAYPIQYDAISPLRMMGYNLVTKPFSWWFVAHTPLNPALPWKTISVDSPIPIQEFSPTQAGIGSSILSRFEQVIAIRRENAKLLTNHLEKINDLQLPIRSSSAKPAYLRFPILFNNEAVREKAFHLLHKRGIGTSRAYGYTLPDKYSSYLEIRSASFPGAIKLAKCLLTLPTHPYLQQRDFDNIYSVLENEI